ncbi:MAG: hypothetical protein ACJAZT_001948 [Gammaproteobacteria bacterium]|jgi:hypothetical protein
MIKTKQAIKNRMPPNKLSKSPARILDDIKKMAEKTNKSHPHSS